MRYIHLFVALVLCLSLSGCIYTSVVPGDYSGATATLADSSGPVVDPSSSWYSPKRYVEPQKADLFYVHEIDGKRLDNVSLHTGWTQQNLGFSLKINPYERDVPIQTMTVGLAGQTYYAAPVGELFNEVYTVSGKVDFTPSAGQTYVVKGVLGKDYSAVWIETSGGRVVTRKVEKRS